MMMQTSSSSDTSSSANQTDNIFMAIYTVELMLKLIGFGFVKRDKGVLRDPWNFFDLLIVSITWINYFLQNLQVNLAPLRSLRILRPLKTISKIPKLKMLIVTIFKSIPHMMDILFVNVFVLTIYAIGGLVLFHGIFKK